MIKARPSAPKRAPPSVRDPPMTSSVLHTNFVVRMRRQSPLAVVVRQVAGPTPTFVYSSTVTLRSATRSGVVQVEMNCLFLYTVMS